MNGEQTPGVTVPERASAGSGVKSTTAAVLAVVAQLLLFDAAVETFWSGSPLRWWVALAVLAFVALSVWLWRPGGWLARRFGWSGAASTSILALLGLLVASAWLPGGQVDGVRMLLQPTSTLLTVVTAVAVALGTFALVRAASSLPATARLITRAVVLALTAYALVALGLGIGGRTPYAALFHGQSLWMRLPFWLQGAFIGGLVLFPAGVVLQAVAAVVGMQGRRRSTDAFLAAASGLSLAVVVAGLAAPARTAGLAGGQLGPLARLASSEQMGNNGPGLRRPATESLQLPVPRAFDLSHVEPAHFAAALGKDPSRIFQYVRDQIAYEAYTGCLRGPRGTLMAMAGNSVDRAALLASLLAHSGYRVRYARGLLPETMAQQLVASMWAERPQRTPAEPEGEPPPDLKTAGERLVSAVKRDGALLRDSLKKAGHPTSRESSVTLEALVKEAQDHYWVEWWQNGAWVDLDPSFATANPGQVYAKAEETFDALPETLFHRVGIRIRLEEYTGDQPSIREILRYTANAADLSGVDLLVTHQPEERGGQGKGYLSQFSPASKGTGQISQVKPLLLVQQQQVMGLPFWQKAPTDRAGGGATDVFGGLDGAETAESVPTATAESIELEFIAPGGRKETVVREIFDLVGKPRRLKGQTLSAEELATRSEASSPDDLTGAFYDLLITTGSIDAAHLRNLTNPPPPAEGEPVDVRAGLRRINIAFSAVSDALLSRIADTQAWVCRFYLDSPRVQIAELSTKAEAPRLSLDLRRNQARAVVTGFRREEVFYAQVLRGVVDGTLERIVIDYFAGSSSEKDSPWAPAISTSLLFERARATNTPTVLLARDSSGLGIEVPEDSRARIDEALAAGYVVLAPKGPIALGGVPRFAWWQIDPRAGTTTAVTDEALHQATVEIGTKYESDGKLTVTVGTRGTNLARVTRFKDPELGWQFVARMESWAESQGLKWVFRTDMYW